MVPGLIAPNPLGAAPFDRDSRLLSYACRIHGVPAGSLHLLLHWLVPAAVALWWDRKRWWRVWAVLMATMVVDLDHLLADPIYDPQRCSIGFHPLHSHWAIAAYAAMLAPRATRLVAVGLLIHMALDGLDCLL